MPTTAHTAASPSHAAAPAPAAALRRPDDWPARLEAFLAEHAVRPFDWGRWNCCLFAAAWVHALLGLDLAAPYKEINTATGALRLLARKGGTGGLLARIAHARGWPQVPPSYARRGDLVLFAQPQVDLRASLPAPLVGQAVQTAVGICCGESFAAVGTAGIEHRPMSAATHAFQIA